MPVHERDWRKLSLEERVDHLRIENVAQQVLINVMAQALGIRFTMGGDEQEED